MFIVGFSCGLYSDNNVSTNNFQIDKNKVLCWNPYVEKVQYSDEAEFYNNNKRERKMGI